MAHRSFSMIEYFNRRCSQVAPRLAFAGRNKRDWRTALLAELKKLLGELPTPVPLSAEVVWETIEDGLIKQRAIFDTEEHMSVPALAYVPADRRADQKLPAILCCHGHGPYDKEAVMGMQLGLNMLTLNIWDGMRTIDHLQPRPEVDPDRISRMGLSGGGTMTTWIGLMDERVKAADRFDVDEFPGEHGFGGRKTPCFFDRFLRAGA